MNILIRISFVLVFTAILISAQMPINVQTTGKDESINALVLLGEWFGDAYFPLEIKVIVHAPPLRKEGRLKSHFVTEVFRAIQG